MRAQFASRRGEIESRLGLEEEREAVALAEKLLQKLLHLREINNNSCRVLTEARLYKEGQRFEALSQANGDFLSAYLRNVIPSPLNWQWIELVAPRSAPEILAREACESALKELASAEAKAMEQISARISPVAFQGGGFPWLEGVRRGGQMDSSSTVSILINVVDNNSAPAIQQVETRLVGLGAAGATTGTQIASTTNQMKGFTESLNQVGTAGATTDASLTALRAQVSQLQAQLASTQAQAIADGGCAGRAAGRDAKLRAQVWDESFNGVRSGIENTRLAAEEMGLRIPRAMQRVMAGNAELAAALQATMGLFIAIGAVAIFEQMIEGAVNLYEKWFDVNKAVEDYQQKAGQAAEQKLFDTASIETTAALLKQVNDLIDQLNAKKQAAGVDQPGGGLLQWFAGGAGVAHGLAGGQTPAAQPFTGTDDAALAQSLKDKTAAEARLALQQQQFAKDRLTDEAAYDSVALKGYAQIARSSRT